MNEQEAIKRLEYIKHVGNGEQEYKHCAEEIALDMAIKALEKQIPKKPNIHGYREGREINTISYTCPICNKHIGRESFCNHCGQALDWGETE